jgi:hypothetical protein
LRNPKSSISRNLKFSLLQTLGSFRSASPHRT